MQFKNISLRTIRVVNQIVRPGDTCEFPENTAHVKTFLKMGWLEPVKTKPVPTPEPDPVPAPIPTPEPDPVPAPIPTPEPDPVPAPVPTPEPAPDDESDDDATPVLILTEKRGRRRK